MNTAMIITRESMRVDRLRYYQIILDGVKVGEIANGERKELEISPGKHTLHLKIDWARSNKITFESDKAAYFNCLNYMKGMRVLLGVFYVLFMPHKYLKLERVKSSQVQSTGH